MLMSGHIGLCLFMVVYVCLFVACSSVLTKRAFKKRSLGHFGAWEVPRPFPGPKKCISDRACHLHSCLETNRHPRIKTSCLVVYVGSCMFTSVHVCLCLFMSANACICLHMLVYVCLCLLISWRPLMSGYVWLCLFMSVCVCLCLFMDIYV